MSALPSFYWVYGLRVRSDVELPGWPAAAAGEPDVEIRREDCDAPAFGENPHTARSIVRDGELQVAVTGVGRFAALRGQLIRIDPLPTALPEDVLLYLTGAMIGAILHQRGLYPLHASCVSIGGVGVGFAGKSGAGKSTLVATLVERGATFVSDDVCVLTQSSTGELVVWPGAPRVKLDEAALANVAARPDALQSAGGNRGKFHLPVSDGAAPTVPVPFHELFILGDDEGEPRIERLSGVEAISALMDETYLLTWAAALGLSAQVFQLVGRVARTLHISRLVRPRGMAHLPETAALIDRRVS
ncbi:MAG: hypothetical protein IPF87_01475 [Gemmatimonadetes bacterium]|nr:hypothetical protein [Gemmatimonadota bacterium]MBK6454747.1 hypothetical protein [Gemmatimonadota bacterium]